MSESTPVVRFAPSPTGFLHVGGARTALFNWLFARHEGGRYLLRIEDTDPERSTAEYRDAILEALEWLGLDHDEAPVYQSRRGELYAARLEELGRKGAVYPCRYTPDQLEAARATAREEGKAFLYPGTCRELTLEEVADRDPADWCLRFRLPADEEAVTFEDMIYGPKSFDLSVLDDFVVARSDGSPTYNFVVVCDDADMGITHVLRGEDHISNTPKQILLYRALGLEPPAFAHLPLLVGPDKKRLSKRHGPTALQEYREDGILAEAMVNFLSLLGWSPGDDRQVMDADEIIQAFDLSRVNRGQAVFDTEKLLWMNAQHVKSLDLEDLAARCRPLMEAQTSWKPSLDKEGEDREWFLELLDLVRDRAQTLHDVVDAARPFLFDQISYEAEAVKKHLHKKPLEVLARMKALREALAEVDPWNEETTEQALRALSEELEVGAGKLIHPLRVALTGRRVSPGIFEVAVVHGKDRTLSRLDALVAFLDHDPVVQQARRQSEGLIPPPQ